MVLNIFVAILSKKAERHFETLPDGPDFKASQYH